MSTSDDLAAYFSTIFTLLLAVCLFMVVRYAESGFPWHSYITLTIGYFVSFGIILVVPIDIATVIQDRKGVSTIAEGDPTYERNKADISEAYSVFFNTILVMGSFVLVFEEYYNTDGFFTVMSKMWSSFKRMMIDTIVGIVAGCAVLGVLIHENIVSSNTDALQLTAVIVTNTMYEFFLMFLLGYGLVGFPRMFWNDSDVEARYERVLISAAADYAEISQSHLNISLEVANALKTKQVMEHEQSTELNAAIDIILEECPHEFRSSRAGEAALNKKGKVDIYSLGELRTRLKYNKSRYRMAQAKVEQTKLEAYYLEDVINAKERNNPDSHKFDGVKRIHWTVRAVDSSEWGFNWLTKYKRIVYGFVALVWATCSAISFVGAICSMKGIDPYNSPYFLAVQDPKATIGGLVLFIFFSLGYASYVTMWSLFQMRMAGLMDLVPGRTTPEALSFNVRMVARLSAPLVFFYLGWISENGLRTGDWTHNEAPETVYANGTTSSNAIEMDSAFSNFYQLQNVDIIQQTFGTAFPIILIAFILMFATNCYNFVCVYLKMDFLQFGSPVVTEEQMRAGKAQLEKSKKSTVNAARRRRFRSFLARKPLGEDGGDNEDEDDDQDTTGGWGGIFTYIFGSKHIDSDNNEADLSQMRKDSGRGSKKLPPTPPPLNGHAALKGSGTLGLTTTWKSLYLEVHAPGTLHFYKDRTAAGKGEEAMEPIELMDIAEFILRGDKGEKLKITLSITKAESTFKFANSEEATDWKSILIAWKDYATEHGREYYKRIGGGSMSSAGGSMKDYLNSSGHSISEMMISVSELEAGLKDDIPDSNNTNSGGDGGIEFNNSGSNSMASGDHHLGLGELGTDVKPEVRDGSVEMTNTASSKWGGKDWKKRYMKIDGRTGEVCIYNHKDDGMCIHILKCANLQTVAPYNKRGGDGKRFNMTTVNDETFKFRCATDAEGVAWVTSLNDWKDYALMNMISE